MSILITCETAGTRVPQGVSMDWRLESFQEPVDRTGGEMARRMADRLVAPNLINRCRHDIVDVSRSDRHRKLFGDKATGLSTEQRKQLVDSIHRPYRESVRKAVEQVLEQFSYAIHLSVRTFPLRENGKLRRTDVGLLYDPKREHESNLCLDWIDEAYELSINLRIRRNYPRRGTVDSLPRWLRTEFSPDEYLGIEVWMNQSWTDRPSNLREEALRTLCDSLLLALGETPREQVA